MKRYRELPLSPEAEAYLTDLRELSDEEFRQKRAFVEVRGRGEDARRRGDVLSNRFARKGTTRP